MGNMNILVSDRHFSAQTRQNSPCFCYLFKVFENISTLLTEIKTLFYRSFIFPVSYPLILLVAIMNQITLILSQKLCCWYLKMPVLSISKGKEGNISKISVISHLLQNDWQETQYEFTRDSCWWVNRFSKCGTYT